MAARARIDKRTLSLIRSLRDLSEREKRLLRDEIMLVKDLMPLIMKPRNKQRWSQDDKRRLAIQLRRLSRISPYLVVLALPGGLLMLPALAWWLDGRRNRNRAQPATPV